jgi:prophage tail gpP-like protein
MPMEEYTGPTTTTELAVFHLAKPGRVEVNVGGMVPKSGEVSSVRNALKKGDREISLIVRQKSYLTF